MGESLYRFFSPYTLWFDSIAIGFPAGYFFWTAILGLIAGSFINVLYYRLPIMYGWTPSPSEATKQQDINLFYPRSFCPNCLKKISWWQNIPLLSYLFLQGQCHHCRVTIHCRYPLIELVSATLSLLIAYLFYGSLMTVWFLVFVWISIVIVILDWRYFLIPDALNYGLLWSGLLFSVSINSASTAIIGACGAYIVFWSIAKSYHLIFKREGLGQGDFKLAAALAAWFGWQALPHIVLIGSTLGLVYALVARLFFQRSLSGPLPYAPWLLGGSLVWLCYQQIFRMNYLWM